MGQCLYIVCRSCERAVEAIDVRYSTRGNLGRIVQNADTNNHQLKFDSESLEIGCLCVEKATDSKPRVKVTLRQILFVISVAAVLLAIFRRPIGMVLDESSL